MPDQAGDRTQEATPHRRRQAREQGQVAKSQDLGSALLLIGAVGAFLFMGATLVEYMHSLTREHLGGEAWLSADHGFVIHQGRELVSGLAKVVLPLMGLMLLLAIAANLFQVGFLFLPDRAAPDISRISLLQGLKRMFSVSSVARLAFGLFKIAIIGGVAFWSVYTERETILLLPGLSLQEIGVFMVEVILWTTAKVGLALLILALFDYAFQRWKHEQDLRMTTQEVREELKNLQGDPHVLARRRAVQRQLVLNRLATAVPKADVVVTNPTELAVAIQYDAETMLAPVVVAKGAGLIAQRIRKLALEHGIPIVEKKPLAQALYKEVEVNHPVPNQQYAAVAEVLAYVYQLQGKTPPALSNAA